jgi:hypothetical protein
MRPLHLMLGLLAVATSAFAAATPARSDIEIIPPSAIVRGFDRLGEPEGERVALVIGNANYEHVTSLDNPLNDARAIVQAASKAGFRVFSAEDVDRRAMSTAIQQFLNAVRKNSVAMIYYAGHGVEVDGENFLLPVDTRDLQPDERFSLEDDAIALNDVLRHLESRGARVNIVMLDACRNNPFSSTGTRSLGDPAGLAAVKEAEGTIVIYSAGTGETALDKLSPDDPNPNGVFTRELIPLMRTPGLEVHDMIQQLKQRVYAAALENAGHSQRPSYYDGLIGDFYFTPASLSEPEPIPDPEPVKEPEFALACRDGVSPDARLDELLFADTARQVEFCAQSKEAFPDVAAYSDLLSIAKEQDRAKVAMLSDDPRMGRAYLTLYPQGLYVRPITEHVATLGPQVTVPAPSSDPVISSEEPAPEPISSEEPAPSSGAPVSSETLQEPSSEPSQEPSSEPSQEPSSEPIISTEPEFDIALVTRQAQEKLTFLGCEPGGIDGKWGSGSKKALERFSKNTKVAIISSEPTPGMVDLLSAYPAGTCPQQIAVEQPKPPKGNGTSTKPTDSTTSTTPTTPKGGCFKFNGKTTCPAG